MPKSGGVFQFSGGRMTSRGQCPRGGCACECLHPPPPFRKSAPVFLLSKFRPPSPPGWLATGLQSFIQLFPTVSLSLTNNPFIGRVRLVLSISKYAKRSSSKAKERREIEAAAAKTPKLDIYFGTKKGDASQRLTEPHSQTCHIGLQLL